MTNLLDLLSGGAGDLPERHRTMRATIQWSEQPLDESSRRLFRRLSVFRGTPALSSVEAAIAGGRTPLQGPRRRPLRGARLLGASDAIRAALGYQMWSATLKMYELVQRLLAEAADPASVEQGREEGSRLGYEQALALAAR